MYEYSAKVERIVDGDTVDLLVDLGFDVWRHDRFRLYGINAAEHGTPAGDAATAFLGTLISPGLMITASTYKDKLDKYGRMLATLTTADGKSVNDTMVSTGHAVPYFGKGPKPVPGPVTPPPQ
jgi:micrococcal nuclease